MLLDDEHPRGEERFLLIGAAPSLRAQAKRSKDPAMRALLADVVAAEGVLAARAREASSETPRRPRKATRRK